MKRFAMGLLALVLVAGGIAAKTLTYNEAETVNLCDRGIPTDERATHVLIARENLVCGCMSGDRCHVFRFDPQTSSIRILASLDGPNTVLKGMALDGDTIYVGTMWTRSQLWLKARKNDRAFEFENANLVPIEPSDNTGHLYKIAGIDSPNPTVEDLGVPVEAEGIHTLAIDSSRELVYGLTYPGGKFFIFDTKTGKTEIPDFGTAYTNVSNHMVAIAEVQNEIGALVPGEGEWNHRLVAKAIHVREDGTLYTSGWDGQILKYDPRVEEAGKRFTAIGYVPSVPGRQHWNRIDEIVERFGKLYLGTSDGYVVRLDPETDEVENFGKPIRSIEVMGLAFSPLDGRLYGVSGGGLEGMSRLWCYDLERGTYEIDYPAIQVFPNRHQVGDVVCTDDGTLVMSEAVRVGNLWVLRPGGRKEWEKSGVLEKANPQESRPKPDPEDRFAGHKKLEVELFPIPSTMHGGSGYTAIQADNEGKIYVGTAYYGETARLVQLDPETAQWRCLFRADELTHQFGRGQGMPGKIHTKLRLGADGKIYGAMKQGYEFHYTIRSDVGEGPEGFLGNQYTCHFFSYDPKTDTVTDLGPGWPQEGITSFDVDTDRGYLYGATVPGVFFLVRDLVTGRVWNAGQIGATHPSRYMPMDPGTGRVYERSETTPEGRNFLTVWDPEESRIRDVEVVPESGFNYRQSYASCCGPAGTNALYGEADGYLFEMDLDADKDGKFHVRPVCTVGVDGEAKSGGMYAIERGPDGRIYWTSLGGNQVPMAIFAWDPKTETKTYLGSCALNGEFIDEGHSQGMCLDPQGNLAIHILYSHPTEEQKKHWSVSEDFYYTEIEDRPYYLGYPAHKEGTYYAVYYLRNATAIK